MNRSLSVTLVGGFLGSGKTSLLHHFISEHAAGPVAVIVEATSALGLDAKAIKGLCGAMGRTRDFVFEQPSMEEPEQIDWLARKLEEFSDAGVGRVLIEVAGTASPARLARHFGFLPEYLVELAKRGDLQRIICVVDALDFFHGVILPQRRGTPVEFLDFQQAQIEGASLLVLNKCDLVNEAERLACREKLREINPRAGLLETAYGETPPELWIQPDSREQLAMSMEERDRDATTNAPHQSAASEFALSSIVYRAHQPFHPARFWDWFEALHPGLLRVKGLVWLATRNLLVGGISRTRWQSSCGGAGIWWAALPREEWPTEIKSLEEMQKSWREPWGDRRQEIELVGDARTLPQIARQLEQCLLTSEEWARPTSEWLAFPDPFPAWDVGSENE